MYDLNDIYLEMQSEIENYDLELVSEAVKNTFIIRDELYPVIEKTLSRHDGDVKFKRLVGKFIDKNSTKLFTCGPVYMIPFGDIDKSVFLSIFNLTEKGVKDIVKRVIKTLKTNSDFKLLNNNPIFWVFYCCIRYYSIKNDKQGLKSALSIYALSVYPSVFSKFFPYGVNEPVMQFTMDGLTDKYLMKKAKHLFGGLSLSIENSYNFLKASIKEGSDTEVIRWIQRIRNDQKSMIYNISYAYMKNYNKGNKVVLNKDANEEIQLDVDAENNTTIVEVLTQHVTGQIFISGVDIKRVSMAKSLSNVSTADLRFYLSKILIDKNTKDVERFVQSILFLYLYQNHKNKNDINSSQFLSWAAELFRKTNSNDPNIANIKNILERWANESGIYTKFKRVATRNDYKKGIFWFFVFSIQYFNK